MLEDLKKVGRIAIRPYCDKTKENMGLEEYGYVVFPGTHQMEEMACIERGGQVIYLNGLNEYSPDIKRLDEDSEERKAKVKEIRKTVAMLERDNNFKTVDPKDPNFWDKIEMYSPNNKKIWGKLSVKLSNEPIYLDPVKNIDHLLIILAIDAGGFPMVSKSLEACKSQQQPTKWYLDKQIITAGVNVSVGKVKNKALALLNALSEDEPRKLFYVAKMIDTISAQYKNNTVADVIYQNMDSFISGEAHEASVKNAANEFMMYAAMSMEELKIKAIVKDATFYKLIILKGDGHLYTREDNVMLGRKPSEVVEFLMNPLNEDVLSRLMNKVEGNW